MQGGVEPLCIDPAKTKTFCGYLSKIAGAAWDTTKLNRESQHEMGVKTDLWIARSLVG
jgi:hypothetical protein